MMKRLLFLLMLSVSLFAQNSLQVVKFDTLVQGNAWVDGDIFGYAVVKNVGSIPIEVAFKRIDENYTELTDSNAICWGLCFTTNISVNPPSFNRVIQPGETDTAITHVYPDLDGYTRSGSITYVFFDYFNPSLDTVAYTVNYQVNGVPLSQPELSREPTLSVYPNPTSEKIQVSYSAIGSSPAQFELLNIVGARVYARALENTNGEFTLPVGDLSPGVYFYTLSSKGQKLISKKLIVK